MQRGALQLQLRSWGTAGGPDPPSLPAPSYKNIHNLEQVGIVLVNYWLLWISQERIVKGGCTLHIGRVCRCAGRARTMNHSTSPQLVAQILEKNLHKLFSVQQ